MRVLLLGKNGLLGSEFVHLLEKKAELFAFGHADLDITDSQKVAAVFQTVRPEFVINTAAYTNVDKAETDRDAAFAINAHAVGSLAKLCKQYGAPLLHFSTDYVFDGTAKRSGAASNLGYVETDLPHPINVYGESKALGEKLLMENTDQFFLVRSSWVFGKNGKNFVKSILEAAKTQPELTVVNDQFGKPTYSVDLANACLAFLSSKAYGVYHIVNEQATNWYDYAVEILKLAGVSTPIRPITTEQLKRPAKRPANSILINSKLFPSGLLRSWKEALNEFLNTL